MTKRKVIRKSNKIFTYNPHYYPWGGDFKNTFSEENIAKMLGSLGPKLGSAIGNTVGGAIDGGLESTAGSAISGIGNTVGSAVGTVNPVLGGIISAGSGIVGGLANKMFGSKLNEKKIAEIEGINDSLNTVRLDNSSVDSIMNQWSGQDFGASFSKSDIGEDGWFSNKAKNKYKELRKEQAQARNRAIVSYNNAFNTADSQNDFNIMSEYYALGGLLDSPAIDYSIVSDLINSKKTLPNSFAKGGKIHIKPENRGKFTRLKERTGKSATWFKEHGTPAQKKMATFALNARKWKHADGGYLDNPIYSDIGFGEYIADRINSMDIGKPQKAALYSSLFGESSFNPNAYNPSGGGKGAHGIMQWRGDRIPNSIYLPDQMDYLEETLNKVDGKNWLSKKAKDSFFNATTPEEASDALERGYVRGEKKSRVKKRKDTRAVYDSMKDNKTLDMLFDSNMRGIVQDNIQIPFKPFAYGGDFSNGIIEINNGGTHEDNPIGGVPMGQDSEGIPNLVEQGEVVFNNYVFSNRLFADKALLKTFNLPESYNGYSFAAIAEKLGDESKERPNDPISKRGLLSSMSRLQQAQETMRQQDQAGQEGVQYAHGGRMGILFDDDVPENTVFDPIGNRYIFTGYQDSDTNPLNFGSGITPSGEWVEEPKYMARAAAKRAGYDVGSSLDDYNKNPIKTPKKKKSAVSKLLSSLDATDLRYAPIVGAAIGLGQNLLSKPDYSSSEAILEAANQAGNYTPVEYTPIGNYLQYRPFDRSFYLNKLNAQAGATRRAIMNTTNPSRSAALLAADYNAQGRLGDLARQAEEYNLAQRQAVETFNRGTNMSNAEMGLKAAMANQDALARARSQRLSGIAQAMAVRDAVDAKRDASMSANLTNLFDSLGNIGIDEMNRADRDMLIRAGVFGTLSEKPQGWSDKRWKDYKKAISGKGYSKGGKLKKRRGGLTY